MGWGRKELADNLANSAALVALPETLKALQDGQKELANGLADLGQRLRDLEKNIEVMAEKIKLDALKEAHSAVQSGMGSMNQRMENFAVKLAQIESGQYQMKNAKALDSTDQTPKLVDGTIDDTFG